MNIKKLFGQKIKEKRIAMGFTQEILVEKISISPKSLSQIELGNNFVSAENLEAICTALSTLPKNLFDFNEEVSLNNLEYIYEKLKTNQNLAQKIHKLITIIE